MRIYYLKNIFKNMWVNWKIYLILLLELILCFSLIYIGFNENISHGKRKALLSQDQENHIHTTQYRAEEQDMQYGPQSPVFNMKELKAIEDHPDILGIYYAEESHVYYMSHAGNIETIDVIIANKDFFEHYLDVSDPESEYCYIMPNLLSKLKSDYKSAPFGEVAFNGECITLEDEEFNFYEISEDIPLIVTDYFYEMDINPKTTVFLLKDEENAVLSSKLEIYRLSLKYKTDEEELDYATRERFFEQLNGYADSEYIFSEMYITQLFKKGGDDMNGDVRNFGWAGQVAFFIVVVGISGIFILIIQKRYKQLCICHINGLTKRGAFMQIFIEVLLLVSIPSIIGMILVITFQGKFNSIYYPIEWHPFTTVVFILLPIVITLIVTVVSSSWLRHLNVVKWLKRIE